LYKSGESHAIFEVDVYIYTYPSFIALPCNIEVVFEFPLNFKKLLGKDEISLLSIIWKWLGRMLWMILWI
jgi:hypothetical protein